MQRRQGAKRRGTVLGDYPEILRRQTAAVQNLTYTPPKKTRAKSATLHPTSSWQTKKPVLAQTVTVFRSLISISCQRTGFSVANKVFHSPMATTAGRRRWRSCCERFAAHLGHNDETPSGPTSIPRHTRQGFESVISAVGEQRNSISPVEALRRLPLRSRDWPVTGWFVFRFAGSEGTRSSAG